MLVFLFYLSHKQHFQSNTFVGTKVKEFSLSTPSCHWFRIWVTDKTVEAKDYKTKLELKNTIDVFMNEGFYITPESDTAHPLPSVIELSSWKFRAQVDNAAKIKLVGFVGQELLTIRWIQVEMSFGFSKGDYVHYGYFEMPAMHENAFRVHIIKAPGCELSLEKVTFPFPLNDSVEFTAKHNHLEWPPVWTTDPHVDHQPMQVLILQGTQQLIWILFLLYNLIAMKSNSVLIRMFFFCFSIFCHVTDWAAPCPNGRIHLVSREVCAH